MSCDEIFVATEKQKEHLDSVMLGAFKMWLEECGVSPKTREELASAGLVYDFDERRLRVKARHPERYGCLGAPQRPAESEDCK